MKKIMISIFSLLTMIMLSINIFADDEVTSSNIFLFGDDVISKKQVMGDIYAFAKGVEVSNSVNGDVISFGKDINIKSDRVLGNIRGAGQFVDIDVKNTKNITVAGQSVKIDENTVSNAIYAAGQNIEFNGSTNDLYLAGSNIIIDGVVNGNLEVRGNNITIGDNAYVYGSINIKSENEPTITGSVAWKDIEYEQVNYKSNFEKNNVEIVAMVMNSVNAIIISILMFILAKGYFIKLNKDVNLYLGKFILVGLALLIGIPVLILTLILTVIGIPIGIMLLGIYICIIYLAPMYTGIILGQKILRDRYTYLQVICGVIALKLIVMLPYIGTIAGLGCMMFMLGSLFISLINYFKLRN